MASGPLFGALAGNREGSPPFFVFPACFLGAAPGRNPSETQPVHQAAPDGGREEQPSGAAGRGGGGQAEPGEAHLHLERAGAERLPASLTAADSSCLKRQRLSALNRTTTLPGWPFCRVGLEAGSHAVNPGEAIHCVWCEFVWVAVRPSLCSSILCNLAVNLDVPTSGHTAASLVSPPPQIASLEVLSVCVIGSALFEAFPLKPA